MEQIGTYSNEPAQQAQQAPKARLNLETLEAYWLTAKASEDEARSDRLKIESLIAEHPEAALKQTGTTTLSALKITTGFNRSFDSEKLEEVRATFPMALWPFRTEYKENRKGTEWLENNEPELWEKIRQALTIKEKKPSFTAKPTPKAKQ